MSDHLSDDLTPEEEALLRGDNTPPVEAEEQSQKPVDPAAPPAAEGDPAPQEDDAGQPKGDDDVPPGFAEYMAKHQGKSPEELMRLAWQQDQARRAARGESADAAKAVAELRNAIARRAQEARERQAREREEFDAKLLEDPDEAARIAFRKVQDRELAEQEQRDHAVYIQEQTRLAASVIPDFETNGMEMVRFGVEALNFHPDEVRAIDDARQLVGLYMAMNYSKLMAQGVVDMAGNIIAMPGQGQQGGGQTPVATPRVDPRLTAPPAPRTLSSAPGGGGQGAKTIRDQVAEALAMADRDFDKLPAEQIEAMLREVGGAGR